MNLKRAAEVRPHFVGDFVERVEARLAELLGEGEGGLRAPAPLVEAARHLCLAGGKRVRPRLVEAFGEALGLAPASLAGEGLVAVAVAAELMHAASLLHDDVVDGGTLRRGRETVNARWGNTVAVLSGDLLLSAALSELRPNVANGVTSPSEVMRLRLVADAVDVVLEMTRAAMNEVAARWRVDLGLEAWRAIAEGKTGVLFGFCGHAAALLADDEAAAARHRRCGHHLGVAFQLADDLDDLLPGAAATGKDRFADVRNGNPSYPLLLAAARSPSLRATLHHTWSARDQGAPIPAETAHAIGDAVLASGAAADTHRAIGEEIAAAQAALGEGAMAQSGAGARIFEQARALWRRAGVEMEACAAI